MELLYNCTDRGRIICWPQRSSWNTERICYKKGPERIASGCPKYNACGREITINSFNRDQMCPLQSSVLSPPREFTRVKGKGGGESHFSRAWFITFIKTNRLGSLIAVRWKAKVIVIQTHLKNENKENRERRKLVSLKAGGRGGIVFKRQFEETGRNMLCVVVVFLIEMYLGGGRIITKISQVVQYSDPDQCSNFLTLSPRQ